MAEYAGNKWYKCDLHLHTMYSKCYLDKENTAQEWVAQAVSRGLNAVAVTDHNDYRGIGEIMEEGRKQGLAVFPGVEITCDTSKIHMLILFDTDKKAENVHDFLNRCDIDSDRIGDPDGTSLGVFEVCEIAKKRGALVIASHIDEFNSISGMNPVNMEKLLSGGYVDAVQVSNVPIWRKYSEDKDLEAMQSALQEKYGPDATAQEIDRWRKCYNRAKEMNIPMLSFSDNPASPTESKHGLNGIGSVYTWIQMDDVVNLESIRQSLFTAESRIRMIFDSENIPQTEPDFWIRSIEVRKTGLNPFQPIRLDFHPQLNCIIGGKGSGKSAIVRIMLGVCRQLSGRYLQQTIDQQDFFYRRETEDLPGIFKEDSEIEICFLLYGTPFRMLVSDIKSMEDQKVAFFRTDPETEKEVLVSSEKLLRAAFDHAQVFVQKQINEMSNIPGALMDFVDHSIDSLYMEKARKEYYLERLVSLSASLHAAENFVENEEKVRSELEWYQLLKKEKNLSEELKETFADEHAKRKETLKRLEACRKEIETLRKQKQELLDEYEACLGRIRAIRSGYISRVFEADENYKIELLPMSSRNSLYEKITETLGGDEGLIAEDIKCLENAVFAKKDAIEQYSTLLLSARQDPNEQAKETGSQGAEQVFSAYFIHLIRKLKDNDFERLLLFRPEDELCLYYHPNGVKRFFPLSTASSGERSTALFSFILSSSVAPLIIDQPEDDMDNRVVYEEVLPKLKKAKQKRQLIIVTHNANITMNADAEMIISMDSKSKFVKVKMRGSVDNDEIRREICDVIEGTEEGFLRRAKKYHLGR